MSEEHEQQWPTWVVVVAILILAIPLIWMLSIFMHVLAAMSIGGILVVVAIIGLFVWLNRRVDEKREA
jgi:nitrate reductase gamma subunit